ncbi:MAG: HIT family protein [Thermoguttaceae bacterium]
MTPPTHPLRETLWAPWRMAYITESESTPSQRIETQPLDTALFDQSQDANCFICQGVVDLAHDAERHIVVRTSETITLLNRFPYNNGHLLVAPRRHAARLDLLAATERAALTESLNDWMNILRRVMNPDGFNVGLNEGHVAGAGLPGHLHWHIVPRWNGDTNFMATLAETRVIPQSLDALWTILRGECR